MAPTSHSLRLGRLGGGTRLDPRAAAENPPTPCEMCDAAHGWTRFLEGGDTSVPTQAPRVFIRGFIAKFHGLYAVRRASRRRPPTAHPALIGTATHFACAVPTH